MTSKIRTVADTPLVRQTTEIAVNKVGSGDHEFIVEQSTYHNLTKRYNPSKFVVFSLTPAQVRDLVERLS
jgi:hypothetical protein